MHPRWQALAVLTLARSAMGLQFQSAAALAPYLTDMHGLNGAGLGSLIGLYLVSGVVLAIPGGWLGQRFGDTRLVGFGLLLMVLGGIAALSDSTAMLFLGRFVAGAGAVLLNVLVTKMVADRFAGHEAPIAMGILIISWPLGIAVAMILLPPLAQVSFLAATILPAVYAAACLVLMLLRFGLAASAPGSASRASSLTRPEAARATLAGGVWTFYNAALITVIAFGPAVLAAQGTDPSRAAATVSLLGWLIIPSLAAGGWLIAATPRPNMLFYLCIAAGVVLTPLAATPASGVLLFAALGLVFGPPGPLIMTLPAQAAPPEKRGLAMGIYFTCYYLGMAAVPPIAGWLWDVTGTPAAALWLASALLAAAAAAHAAFGRPAPREV